MQAYQRDAKESLDQWHLWDRIRCPVMLIHGLHSDALLPPTIERMARTRAVTIMHVPDTGHTPVLADSQPDLVHPRMAAREPLRGTRMDRPARAQPEAVSRRSGAARAG